MTVAGTREREGIIFVGCINQPVSFGCINHRVLNRVHQPGSFDLVHQPGSLDSFGAGSRYIGQIGVPPCEQTGTPRPLCYICEGESEEAKLV